MATSLVTSGEHKDGENINAKRQEKELTQRRREGRETRRRIKGESLRL
jgi:hypothetical protein